jgi:hypothetical protein
MSSAGWIGGVRACALGATDGALYGAAIGGLNELYLRGATQPTHYDVTVGNVIILMASPIPPRVGHVVISCAFAFALVSYGAHRLWPRRISSLLILWQVVGICSFVLLSAAAYLMGRESYYASLPRGATLLGLVVVVIISFIFGVVVESSVKLYSRS